MSQNNIDQQSKLQEMSIQQALSLHREGKISQAENAYLQLLKTNPADINANHLLGTLYFQAKRYDLAKRYLMSAIELKPDSADSHCLLGSVYQALEQPEQAISSYQLALKLKPNHGEAQNNLGTVFSSLGRYQEAATSYRNAIKLMRGNPNVYVNLGNVLEKLGHLENATNQYLHALKLSPNDPELANLLGNSLRSQGRSLDSVRYYRQALETNPDHAIIHNNLGAALNDLGRFDDALSSYQAAIKLRPNYATAYKNIAALYEQTNKIDLAEEYIQRALSLAPENPSIQYTQAVLLKRKKETAKAIQILSTIDRAPYAKKQLGARKEQLVQFELGRLYDQSGDVHLAMNHFTQGNRLASQLMRVQNPRPDKNIFLRQVNSLTTKLPAEHFHKSLESINDKNTDAPIFLLGFPRSGTTLLDQILDSHPRLQVMEERPTLLAVGETIDQYYQRYPESITNLQPADLENLRQIYWHKASQYISHDLKTVLIDKYPLNTQHIPLISTLFPNSRILVALRHPCDVVLSCFMQNFRINHAMANFLSLEDSVQLYCRVMRLWLNYQDSIPVNYHIIRYEDLVTDFQPTLESLITFLDIEWDDALLNYNKTAKSKHIHTPSYQTVSQPIFTHAKYRWKRYESYLKPFINDLKPFIDRLGYDM